MNANTYIGKLLNNIYNNLEEYDEHGFNSICFDGANTYKPNNVRLAWKKLGRTAEEFLGVGDIAITIVVHALDIKGNPYICVIRG